MFLREKINTGMFTIFFVYTVLGLYTIYAASTSKNFLANTSSQETPVNRNKSLSQNNSPQDSRTRHVKKLETLVNTLKKKLKITLQKEKKLTHALAQSLKEYNSLSEEYATLFKGHEKLETQIDLLQLDIAEKTQLISTLQKKLLDPATTRKNAAKYIRELQEKNLAMDKTMSRLQRIIANQKINQKQRDEELTKAMTQLKPLTKKLISLKSLLKTTSEELSVTKQKSIALQKENKALEKETTEQATQIVSLDRRLKESIASEEKLGELLKEYKKDHAQSEAIQKSSQKTVQKSTIKKQAEIPVQPPPPGSIRDVILRPGLLLDISVSSLGKVELQMQSRRISNTGNIRLDYVGKKQVNALFLEQFREQLRNFYSEYYHFPEIDIQFVVNKSDPVTYPWGHVTMLGRVNKQGRVFFPPSQTLTISEAIQQAGGFASSPWLTRIKVTRMHPDGKEETIKVNLKPHKNAPFGDDIYLQPGDSVYVPESWF